MAAMQGEHIPLAQGSQLCCVSSDFQCSIWSSISSFGFPHGLEVLLLLAQSYISRSLGHCRVFCSMITKLCWLRPKKEFFSTV